MSPVSYIHVIAGTTGLLTGIVIMALPSKGNKLHRRLGKAYFYAMLVSTVIAIGMSAVNQRYFLLYIGIFTLYMLLSGYISLPSRFTRYKRFIAPLVVIGLITAVCMFLTHVIFIMVFGGLLCFLAVQDISLLFRKKLHVLDLTGSHAGKMAGSFIAATTAFCVNVVFTGSEWWHWLLPTMTITPLIVFWNIRLGIRKKQLLANA